MNRAEIAHWANVINRAAWHSHDFAPHMRCSSAPHLSVNSSRETLIRWLQWNDPNGSYSDEEMELEGEDPMTVDDAWDQVEIVVEDVKDDYPEENPMEGGAPAVSKSPFWKSRLGITSIIVGGAAAAGAIGYAVSAKKTAASASGSSSGASNNPGGPYLTAGTYLVTPGQWYTFDIGSSSHWTDANWQATGAPALEQALVAAGFNAGLVIQPDPSDPSASTYLVAAQWPSGATATQFTDNPPAWYVKPATMQAIQGTPAGVQSYTVPSGNWFTFTVWTGLAPSDPNFADHVRSLLSAAGWGTFTNGQVDNILVTQSATNPADANVAALWAQGAGGTFRDGWPLWGIVGALVDTGSTAQPSQPGA